MAYVDDLVFILKTEQELSLCLKKLHSLDPHLSLNLKKCSIIKTGNILNGLNEFQGIPIVKTFKYLGFEVTTSTQSVFKTAVNKITQCFHN